MNVRILERTLEHPSFKKTNSKLWLRVGHSTGHPTYTFPMANLRASLKLTTEESLVPSL